MAISTWLIYQNIGSKFSPKVNYRVYEDLRGYGNFLKFSENRLDEVLTMFDDAVYTAQLFGTYISINGFVFVLMLTRMLKVLDFQERIGIVTATIRNAGSDLAHFGLLFSMIFGGFSCLAHLFFGNSVLPFSTWERSMNTCFDLLMGDIGIREELFLLSNRLSAILFYYSFIFLVFFILLNVLLAIIVEAYVQVKEQSAGAKGIPSELAEVVAAAFKNLKAMKCSCKQTGKSQVSEMRDHSVARTASRWLEHEEERRLAQERLSAGPDADARKWEFEKGTSVTEATAAAKIAVYLQHIVHPDTDSKLAESVARTMLHRYGKGGPKKKKKPKPKKKKGKDIVVVLDSNKYVTPVGDAGGKGTDLAGGSLEAGMNSALSPDELAAMAAAAGGANDTASKKEGGDDGFMVMEEL